MNAKLYKRLDTENLIMTSESLLRKNGKTYLRLNLTFHTKLSKLYSYGTY